MNEVFTEEYRRVIELSHDEALRLHNDYIGTEHLLLGILRLGTGKAKAILENAGAEADTLRQSIEDVVQPTTSSTNGESKNIPFTSRAKRVLEVSSQEARALKEQYINTEHLLLALAKDAEGVAAQVLAMFDIEYADVYRGLHTTSGTDDGKNLKRINWVDFPMTEAVRDVIRQAQANAAQRANDETIISHLLLGIIANANDPATHALATQGVNLQELQQRLEDFIMLEGKAKLRVDLTNCKITVQRPLSNRTFVPLSSGAKKILIEACHEMNDTQRAAVDTTCLLLAILAWDSCKPARLISRYNVNYVMLRMHLDQNA